jgi:hypothetical protein
MSVHKVNECNAPHVGEEHSPTPSCFDQISDSPSLVNNGYRTHYDGGWPAYNDKWMVTTLTAINGIVMKCTYRNREPSLTATGFWPSGKEAIAEGNKYRKGRCTLSVNLSDFTVWRHTWRKNLINCAVLTGNSAGLRTVLSSRLSHRELRSSLRKSHSFLSLPADTTMASSQDTPFLAVHSTDEHRMIYSFSNATSYFTFYAFFSSFRITLWPMWLANNKRQPCFYPP